VVNKRVFKQGHTQQLLSKHDALTYVFVKVERHSSVFQLMPNVDGDHKSNCFPILKLMKGEVSIPQKIGRKPQNTTGKNSP
jgi:hypothetical protein